MGLGRRGWVWERCSILNGGSWQLGGSESEGEGGLRTPPCVWGVSQLGARFPLHLPGRTSLALLTPGRMGPIAAVLQLPGASLRARRGEKVHGPAEEALDLAANMDLNPDSFFDNLRELGCVTYVSEP